MPRGRYPCVKKTMVDGHVFDSKREASRYLDLMLMQSAGVIRGLALQPRYKITIGRVPVLFPNGRHLTYVADFKYFDTKRDAWVIEDCKGHMTDVFKIKRALMLAMGLDILLT